MVGIGSFFWLHIEKEHNYEGFTLLEVLLTVTLTSLLVIGMMGFFFEIINGYYSLNQRSEAHHQVMTGLESIVTELQSANPATLVLLTEIESGSFSEVRFSKYDSPDLYWFYINAEGTLVRAVQRLDSAWGRTGVAQGVTDLRVLKVSYQTRVLKISLSSLGGNKPVVLSSFISIGF